jgi:hypothetical protein
MIKRSMLTLCALALPLFAGCGQVVVFGHVVREGAPSSAVTPDADRDAGNNASASKADNAAGGAEATAASQAAATAQSAESSSGTAATAHSAEQATSSAQPPARPQTRATGQAAPAARVVNAVSLSLSPSAAAEAAGDSSFVTDTLLTAIKAELTARGLLDEQGSRASSGTAEILIDHVGKRPTVNAVVFGQQLMAGTLSGAIRVRASSGEELPEHQLVAESRLSIAADGSNKNPLGPLYKRFAVLAADQLAGVESKPVNISADGQPRS